MTRLSIRVKANARQDALLAWDHSVLWLSVRAVRDRGRANEAVVALLAAALGLRRQQIELLRGHRGTRKLVAVDLPADELSERLLRATQKP